MTPKNKREYMEIGIDLVDISRMAKKIERNKDFVRAFLCQSEIDSLKALNLGESIICAARYFAIKEAVLKALKLGMGNGLELCEIEVQGDFKSVRIDKKPFSSRRFVLHTSREDNLLIALAIVF